MKSRDRVYGLQGGALLVLFLVAQGVWATQNGDRVDVNFTGRMEASTQCTVNEGQPVEVHFGNVGIKKVESGKYLEPVPYRLDCGSANSTNTVSLKLKAIPAAWDAHAMSTSAEGLGVYILHAGDPIELNSALPVDPADPPMFEALLVQDPTAALSEQPFSATGTLLAEYY